MCLLLLKPCKSDPSAGPSFRGGRATVGWDGAVFISALSSARMSCWRVRFRKMEQSTARHFIFTNNPTFLFGQCDNPNAGRSHVRGGGVFARGTTLTWLEQGKWVEGSDQMGNSCRGDDESEALLEHVTPTWTWTVPVAQFSRCYFYRFYQVLINYPGCDGKMNVREGGELGDATARCRQRREEPSFSSRDWTQTRSAEE